jgi:hypothetical protein
MLEHSLRRKAMTRLFISLIAVLLCACASSAQSRDSADPCKGLDKRIAALASQYRELRERRRRLPQGSYDKDLSGSEGTLPKVLSSLGSELGRPPYTRKIIESCMGEPDAVKAQEQMRGYLEIYNRERRIEGRQVEAKGKRVYLIYFWRGWHDFMFFISEDGRIVDHGWWFAYE